MDSLDETEVPDVVRLLIGALWDGSPIADEECAWVRLSGRGASLVIDVDAPYYGDPAPPGLPGSCDGLWEYEVVEVFLLGAGGVYVEIELGPHGHYLVLRLVGRRRILVRGLPLEFRVRERARRWRGRARVPAALLPEDVQRANAYAIHGTGAERRHLAAYPVPGPEPDFHRLEHFRPIRLPAGIALGSQA